LLSLLPMSKSIPIRHNLLWANIYIVIGLFCTLFFLVGAFMLNQFDSVIYAIASIGPIFIGFIMRKSNYALVSKNHIQVFGLFGQLRKDYKLDGNATFIIKANRYYFKKGNELKKVSMNNWFINPNDWKRALELFETNEFEKITKHLIDD